MLVDLAVRISGVARTVDDLDEHESDEQNPKHAGYSEREPPEPSSWDANRGPPARSHMPMATVGRIGFGHEARAHHSVAGEAIEVIVANDRSVVHVNWIGPHPFLSNFSGSL